MQMVIGHILLIVMSWSYSPIQPFIKDYIFFSNNSSPLHQNYSHKSLNHKHLTTDKLTLKGCLNDFEKEDSEDSNKKEDNIKQSYLIFKDYNNSYFHSLSFLSLQIKIALTKSWLKFFSNPYPYIRHSIYRL